MQVYSARAKKLTGTSYEEVERHARRIYNRIASTTKRNAYVRSAYFKGSKIFLATFWDHINQKPRSDRKRRFRYYACAVELLRFTKVDPLSKENPNKMGEILHGELFYVQVKEHKRTGNKYFMSVFPPH